MLHQREPNAVACDGKTLRNLKLWTFGLAILSGRAVSGMPILRRQTKPARGAWLTQ